jgi:antitoxin component YwqK of YwqJK toxin-antitoxin module
MKRSLLFLLASLLAASLVNAQRIPLINSGEVLKRVTELQDSQKFELAIKQLLAIPKRDTNYMLSQSQLADLYLQNKQFELAEATANSVLKRPSAYGAAMWRVKTNLYDEKKEYDKSIEMVEAGLKEYPFDVELRYLQGIIYHNKHDYKKAAKAYFDVLAIAPRNLGTHLNLGNLALYLGDKTHAMMSFGMYLALKNSNNEKLQLLDNIASGQVDWEGKGAAEKINNNAYERLDQIIRSRIAMDKKFKTVVPIDIAIVRQFELMFKELNTASAGVDDPWMKFYGPIYSGIRDNNMIEPFLYHLLESTPIEVVKKWNSKHEKELKAYFDLVNPLILRVRETVEVPPSIGISSPAHAEYYENKVEGIGGMNNGKRHGAWRWYHTNGALSAEGNYDNGKKTGNWKYYSNENIFITTENHDTGELTEWYPDGTMKVHYFLKDKKVEGEITFYYPCGGLSERRTHKDGKRTGKAQMWYENGVVKSEYEYIDDKLTDAWIDYDERGEITGKVTYKDDLRDGNLERFWPNGKLRDRYAYAAGKAQGSAEGYHDNGVLQFKGQYLNDLAVGEWIYQNRKGEKIEVRNYNNEGKLDMENTFFYHGKVYTKHTFRNDVLIGIVWYDEDGNEAKKFGSPDGTFEGKHNFQNGKLLSEGKYKNGKREGKWTQYFVDGLVSAEYNYVDGEFHGEQTEFFRSGKKNSVSWYKNGARDGYQVVLYQNGQVSREGWQVNDNNQQQWLSYYPDGTIDQDNYYRDGRVVDTVYYYAVDGKLWAYDVYNDGSRTTETAFDPLQVILYDDPKTDGEQLKPYQSGSVHTKYTVKCGKVNGAFARFFPNGKTSYVSHYLNDVRNGSYKAYDFDGTLRTEGDYLSGSRHGVWTRYNRIGKLSEVTKYVNGNEDSLYTDYYPFGKPYKIAEYNEGELDGISRFLAPDGTPVAEKKYLSNQLIEVRTTEKNGQFGPWKPFSPKMNLVGYYPNGTKAYEENYEAGTLSGPKRIYFPNGKLCREYYYVNGTNEGAFADYYLNGGLCMKGQYRSDMLDGVVEVYDETGTLIRTVTYKLGEVHGPTVYYTKKVQSAQVEFYNGLPLK